MHIVRWRAACVAPTVTQTFRLNFVNTTPEMKGDNSFADVPVGIDPTTWPLDVDRDATEKAAKKEAIFPGGKLRVYGNFCWGGNAQRAELYMVPKNQPAPTRFTGDLAAALSAALSGVETKAEEERFCSGDRCEMKRPA